MMVLEGFIAMVWAAGAMGAYNKGLQVADPSLATQTVGIVCKGMLGHVGGIIALLGVIVLPITSGDTALRSLRMSLSETFHIDQSTGAKRMGLAAIIFTLVAAILAWAKFSNGGFAILWRYFAWSNQTLALFALASIAIYLIEHDKTKFVWMPLIPGFFYAFVTFTYICNAKIGFNIPWTGAYIAGAVFALVYTIVVVNYGKKRAANILKAPKE
jgi:carbon starvation protein CstA